MFSGELKKQLHIIEQEVAQITGNHLLDSIAFMLF